MTEPSLLRKQRNECGRLSPRRGSAKPLLQLAHAPGGDQPLSQLAQMAPEMDAALGAEIDRLAMLLASQHGASLPGACA